MIPKDKKLSALRWIITVALVAQVIANSWGQQDSFSNINVRLNFSLWIFILFNVYNV